MMVCAQLVAFGRVSMRREERRERARRRKEKILVSKSHAGRELKLGNGHVDESYMDCIPVREDCKITEGRITGDASDGSDGSFVESTDSEVIL